MYSIHRKPVCGRKICLRQNVKFSTLFAYGDGNSYSVIMNVKSGILLQYRKIVTFAVASVFSNFVTWKHDSEVLQEEAYSNITRSLELTGRLFNVLI
jgi:hypothetical protein